MSDPELVTRKTEEDGVEVLTLRHPPVNALSLALLDALRAHLEAIDADPSSRAVILTGDGQYFSAGADLKELATLDLAQAPAIVARGQALFSRLEALRPPVIAAINGLALGGGLELALCADFRVLGESAKVGQPEILLGIIPGAGGTQRLPRLIGPARAKDLIFSGRHVAAAEALAIGLADRVVPDAEVYQAARDLVAQYAAGPALALRAAKQAVNRGLEVDLATGLEIERVHFAALFATEDQKAGMTSFMENGPGKAVFEGR